MSTISCSVGYHRGGLGQHFSHLVEAARLQGHLRGYFSSEIHAGDDGIARTIKRRLAKFVMHRTPVRYFEGLRWHLECESWDRKVARLLEPPLDSFTAFAGQALHSFRAARALGCQRLELIASNSHVLNCLRQHRKALERHPIEKGWLNSAHRRKTLEEYKAADQILVASEYTRQIFISEGEPADKLKRVHYPADPRFTPDPAAKTSDGVFRIVYIGAVTVVKGIPVLLEAFDKLRHVPAELTLVGGTCTRGMRKYIAAAIARDPRIRLAPGDPLPHLRRADVCVHPSWEDGLAYAPLEAIATGVPVVVTADTGMKEYVVEGQNGYVIPTGDIDALLERLVHLSKHPLTIVPRNSAVAAPSSTPLPAAVAR